MELIEIAAAVAAAALVIFTAVWNIRKLKSKDGACGCSECGGGCRGCRGKR